MYTRNIVVLMVSFILVISGCDKTPKEMPKVYPCVVTLLHQEKSLANIEITLVPISSGAMNVITTGTTDESGKATMTTYVRSFNRVGVPQGKLKVVLNDTRQLKMDKSKEELSKMTIEQTEKYIAKLEKEAANRRSYVSEKMTSVDTTPLEIEVTDSPKNDIVLDLAKFK